MTGVNQSNRTIPKLQETVALSYISIMSTTELVSTGILMGMIHVLTGPDHLSALATLCGTDIKSSSRIQQQNGESTNNATCEASLHGIRWGVGHSIGLLVVASILIAMEESSGDWIAMDPMLKMIAEIFVGIFMLGLGAYGLYKADRNNRDNVIPRPSQGYRSDGTRSVMSFGLDVSDYHEEDDDSDNEIELTEEADVVAAMEDVLDDDRPARLEDLDAILGKMTLDDNANFDSMLGNIKDAPCDMSFVTIPMKPTLVPTTHVGHFAQTVKMPYYGQQQQQQQSSLSPAKPPNSSAKSVKRASSFLRETADNSIVDTASSTGSVYSRVYWWYQASCCGVGRQFFRSTPSVLALMAGLVHGVAGPGGVLGVIPAVQLRDTRLAALYLGTFCLTSTAVMGAFAAFYGTFSAWLAGGGTSNRIFMVEIGSALLSVCVGFIWLSLLTMGKLDEVFP